MINLTFSNDRETKLFILAMFNKTVDDYGYIIDADTGNLVLDQNKSAISLDDFGGVRKGSEIFMKDGLVDAYQELFEAGQLNHVS